MSQTGARRRLRGTSLLLLLCCGLSATIYFKMADPMAPATVAALVSSPSPPLLERGPRFSMPPLASFAEVVARPLFSPTRRPSAKAARETKAPDFTLVGIVVSPEGRRVLLSHGIPPQLEHLVEGQSIDGWTVTSITPDRVVLAQGGMEAEIRPMPKPPPTQNVLRPGAAPVPPPPPAAPNPASAQIPQFLASPPGAATIMQDND